MSDAALVTGLVPLPSATATISESPLALQATNTGGADFQAVLAAQLGAVLQLAGAPVSDRPVAEGTSPAEPEDEEQSGASTVQLTLASMLAALPAAPEVAAMAAMQQGGVVAPLELPPGAPAPVGVARPAVAGAPAEHVTPAELVRLAPAAVVAAAPADPAAELAAAYVTALPSAQDATPKAAGDAVRNAPPLLGEPAHDEAAPQTPTLISAERGPELAQRSRDLAAPLDAPVRLTSRNLGEDVGNRVLWMASQRQQVAELRIDPPNLGPVEVRLSIDNDRASVTLLSPHGAVRDALQAHLPRLQEMMLTAGLDLTSVYVGADGAGQQRHWGLAEGPSQAMRDDGVLPIAVSGIEPMPGRAGLGMVDVYA